MSNKKRIRKRQKSIQSHINETKMWECVAMAMRIINHAMALQQDIIRASQPKKSYPIGGFIPNTNGVERILGSAGGWKPVPMTLNDKDGMYKSIFQKNREPEIFDISIGEKINQLIKAFDDHRELVRNEINRIPKQLYEGYRNTNLK